jgi:hypothetical protein
MGIRWFLSPNEVNYWSQYQCNSTVHRMHCNGWPDHVTRSHRYKDPQVRFPAFLQLWPLTTLSASQKSICDRLFLLKLRFFSISLLAPVLLRAAHRSLTVPFVTPRHSYNLRRALHHAFPIRNFASCGFPCWNSFGCTASNNS